MLGRVAECLAQPGSSCVQVVVEIDENVFRPEASAKIFARDGLPGVLQKHRQDLERLIAKLEFDSVLAKKARRQIDFKVAEANEPAW